MMFTSIWNEDGSDVALTPDDAVRRIDEAITKDGYFFMTISSRGRNLVSGFRYSSGGSRGLSGIIACIQGKTFQFAASVSGTDRTYLLNELSSSPITS